MDLHTLLVEESLKEGFILASTIDIDLAFADPSGFQSHLAHYDQWLAEGRSGAMDYLKRGRDRRADPRQVFPEAESMLCVAFPYPKQSPGASDPQEGPQYARYLKGPDYHLLLSEKLERVLQATTQRWGPPLGRLRWKVCVDTSAILERTWAAMAGLGWIGKNTTLIHPTHGSYFFLAEVLLNQKGGRGPQPLPNYCGNCTRCLQACPTQALEAPQILNANQCISYWTLEKRGELSLSTADQKKMGRWVAGCDICQEVCPFNMKPTRQYKENSSLTPDATVLKNWTELLAESEVEYKGRVKDSALNRVKPAQFRRNLGLTLENFVASLSSQNRADLSPQWDALIRFRIENETDETVRPIWERCLNLLRTPT